MTTCKLSLGLLVLGMSTLTSLAAGETVCGRLASEARRLPAQAWSGLGEPLGKFLQIARRAQGQPLSALETTLIRNQSLREELALSAEQPVDVDRLAGTSVYRLDSIQGTAHCQSSVFVEAKPGAVARQIKAPFEAEPCWTQAGEFAQVFGRPSYVVHGAGNQLTMNTEYQIATWTGHGWGQACKLALAFEKSFRQIGEFCSDPASCESGRGPAAVIGKAYDLARERGEAFDANAFATGLAPGAEFVAKVQGLDPSSPPDFPTFAADRRSLDVYTTNYSNEELQYFPLSLNGRWLVGLVGHAGVGWRESAVTLVSFFELSKGGLRPVAGFQIQASRGRLIRALVDDSARQ